MDIIDTIKDQIGSNAILLYMKGSPNAPQCGFSASTVQALMACGHGELVGGCDIITEMHASGELKTMIDESAAKTAE